MILIDVIFPPAIFIIFAFGIFFGSTADNQRLRSEEPSSPISLSRGQSEFEIAKLLHSKVVIFPPNDPVESQKLFNQRKIESYTFFSDADVGGRELSETTFDFDGCVIVERIMRKGEIVRRERRNVTFLNTSPAQIEVRQSSNLDGIQVLVDIPFRSDIQSRLDKLGHVKQEIINKAYELYPKSVPERLMWIKRQYENKIDKSAYVYASQTDFDESGITITSPVSYNSPFRLPRMQAEKFIYLLDHYHKEFCNDGR